MKSNHFAEVGKMSEKKEFKPLDAGATERLPWELAQRLREFFHIDKDGNITLGGSLEVDGTTKMNSGFEPIHAYTFKIQSQTYTLNICLEKQVDRVAFNFCGTIVGYSPLTGNDTIRYCTGTYEVDNGVFRNVVFLTLDGGVLALEEMNVLTNTYNLKEFVAENENSDVSELQPKLYRHVILLGSNNQYNGYIVYITTSNLKADSLQDLTTLLKPTSNYEYPLSGICSGLDSNNAIQVGTLNAFIKSFNKIEYKNNLWYFSSVLSNYETIDEVTDTVTAL